MRAINADDCNYRGSPSYFFGNCLDDVEDAFHKMERGEVLRSVVTI